MTSQSRKRPAYLRISDALRDKIERNELEPGQKFPTERELVREFHVARMTVRHALDILEVEGLIDRRRGRSGGTYVRTVPPTLSLTNKDNIVTQLRERGHDVSVRLAMRYGNPSIASQLDELKKRGCTRILVVPMYPQYSGTTTASVIDGKKLVVAAVLRAGAGIADGMLAVVPGARVVDLGCAPGGWCRRDAAG